MNFDETETDWMIDRYFESKDAYRSLEELLLGKISMKEYGYDLEAFFENAHLNYLEEQAQLRREAFYEVG
jgi:hypothetical protein